ncbi:MAG: cell division protein ZapA [Clostridia bacterium]|nr:cell division protein ZapA [Clostridia bacterium]
MDTISVSVQIAGRDYTLSSSGSAEQTQRVAALVDRKMRELMASGVAGRESAAVLAALTYAEALIQSEDDNARLRRRLDEAASR